MNKNILLLMILINIAYGKTEVGKWQLIHISEYKKELQFPEDRTPESDLFVICDSQGEVANFVGTLLAEDTYECADTDQLVSLMSINDKKKTYLRKFNGELQYFTLNK